MRTAIILGATGLTGRILLDILVRDPNCDKIKLFSRSSVGIEDPKIEEYLGDILELKDFKGNFFADVVFCCIGTTKAKTPDKNAYRNIDFGIPVNAANLAKENGIPTFIVVSALGADSKSVIFYNRVKGEMEEAVTKANIPRTYILQPSLIGGDRKEKRAGEALFKQLMKIFDQVLVGPLKKYRTIHPGAIAQCMVWLAHHDHDKIRIKSDEIKKIALHA